MHIKEDDHKYLERKKMGCYFYAADAEKKKRGVAIYIGEEWNPQLIEKTSDGRILAIELTKDEQKCFQ